MIRYRCGVKRKGLDFISNIYFLLLLYLQWCHVLLIFIFSFLSIIGCLFCHVGVTYLKSSVSVIIVSRDFFFYLSLLIAAWISNFSSWSLIVLGFSFREISLRLVNSAFTLVLVLLNSSWQYSVHLFVISSDVCSVFPCLSLIVLSIAVHFLFKTWSTSMSFSISFPLCSPQATRA